jgi:hypothetical protein
VGARYWTSDPRFNDVACRAAVAVLAVIRLARPTEQVAMISRYEQGLSV